MLPPSPVDLDALVSTETELVFAGEMIADDKVVAISSLLLFWPFVVAEFVGVLWAVVTFEFETMVGLMVMFGFGFGLVLIAAVVTVVDRAGDGEGTDLVAVGNADCRTGDTT